MVSHRAVDMICMHSLDTRVYLKSLDPLTVYSVIIFDFHFSFCSMAYVSQMLRIGTTVPASHPFSPKDTSIQKNPIKGKCRGLMRYILSFAIRRVCSPPSSDVGETGSGV